MHMRDILIVLSVCVAAVAVGAGLYFFGPPVFREMPAEGMEQMQAQSGEAFPLSEDTAFRPLAAGTAANVEVQKNYAAYDADGLAEVWALSGSAESIPALDFEKEYVIGVFAGQKPSGGHSIAVSGIRDTNGSRVVSIVLTEPGAGCVSTQALTSPYQIIAVPYSDSPLTREYATVQQSCQ